MEEFDDSKKKTEHNENRTLVFDRIESPKPCISVFERLKSCNQVRLSSNLHPHKSVFKRLESSKPPSKQTHQGEFKEDLKDNEIRNSILSRMK